LGGGVPTSKGAGGKELEKGRKGMGRGREERGEEGEKGKGGRARHVCVPINKNYHYTADCQYPFGVILGPVSRWLFFCFANHHFWPDSVFFVRMNN